MLVPAVVIVYFRSYQRICTKKHHTQFEGLP